MNRRTRTILVLSIAVGLASVAAFGVYRAIRNIPVRYVPIATKYAVVAREPVPVGALLTKEQLVLVAWPADAPVPGGFDKIEDVVGRGVIAPLVQNEPVSEAKLASKNAGGGLPPTIPQGMRAMAVRVNDVIGVAGFTVPGTRVDVIVTVRSAQKESISRVVLNNVQVLTAGTRMDQEKSKDGQAIPNTTVVTLLLTPHDAEKLALAQTDGTIVLALRNPLDTDPAETNGARMNALLSGGSAVPDAKPVERPAGSGGGAPRPKATAPAPPPPPPPPYTIETIRGAQRTDVVIK